MWLLLVGCDEQAKGGRKFEAPQGDGPIERAGRQHRASGVDDVIH